MRARPAALGDGAVAADRLGLRQGHFFNFEFGAFCVPVNIRMGMAHSRFTQSNSAVATVVASVVLTFTELQTQHTGFRVFGPRMRRVVLLSLWMSMARADVTADFDALEVERRAKAAIDMAGCPERTQWQHATLPNELEPGIPSAVYWLLSLFSAEDTAEIVTYLREHATFSTHPGSTDMQPEFASYIYTHGAVIEDAPWKNHIWIKLSELLASCVTPFVRQKFACATCVPCTSLVRRYRPKERKQIFAHRDAESKVTLVLELQPARPVGAAGGLYIMEGTEANRSFPALAAGDAFVHGHELLHGVYLACADRRVSGARAEECERLSLIVWYHEDRAQCVNGVDSRASEEMLIQSASKGVAEGLYAWAVTITTRYP